MSKFQDHTRAACAMYLYLVMEEVKLMEEAKIEDDEFIKNVNELSIDLRNRLNVIHEETKDAST